MADGSFEWGSGGSGGESSLATLIVRKTGIADNTATDVLRITVPNVNGAAFLSCRTMASTGGANAFEGTRVAYQSIAVNRVAGAAAFGNVGTAALAGSADGGDQLTSINLTLEAVAGAVTATNTFDVQVTVVDSSSAGAIKACFIFELLNSEAGGVTMAAL
jgi:hypothetical protein